MERMTDIGNGRDGASTSTSRDFMGSQMAEGESEWEIGVTVSVLVCGGCIMELMLMTSC